MVNEAIFCTLCIPSTLAVNDFVHVHVHGKFNYSLGSLGINLDEDIQYKTKKVAYSVPFHAVEKACDKQNVSVYIIFPFRFVV